jgi:hypothetical protein
VHWQALPQQTRTTWNHSSMVRMNASAPCKTTEQSYGGDSTLVIPAGPSTSAVPSAGSALPKQSMMRASLVPALPALPVAAVHATTATAVMLTGVVPAQPRSFPPGPTHALARALPVTAVHATTAWCCSDALLHVTAVTRVVAAPCLAHPPSLPPSLPSSSLHLTLWHEQCFPASATQRRLLPPLPAQRAGPARHLQEISQTGSWKFL